MQNKKEGTPHKACVPPPLLPWCRESGSGRPAGGPQDGFLCGDFDRTESAASTEVLNQWTDKDTVAGAARAHAPEGASPQRGSRQGLTDLSPELGDPLPLSTDRALFYNGGPGDRPKRSSGQSIPAGRHSVREERGSYERERNRRNPPAFPAG